MNAIEGTASATRAPGGWTCCKNRHLWLDQKDAEKCCSGQWRRVLVFGGGTHPQLCAGVIVGRAWELLPNESAT